MTSQRVENSHVADLNKLFLDSGLTCDRSPLESEESSIESEDTEKTVYVPEEESVVAEAIAEEETEIKAEEEEELPKIFPTPSLRRVLPDKIRQIEKQNVVHVLPEEFKQEIDPLKIPKIASTPPQTYISQLADLTGCKSYRNSLAEYWFLDTLANLLRRAQKDSLDKPTQALLIQWFCEWMREMQYFDAADRQRMLRRFKDNMLSAAGFVAKECRIPAPPEIGVSHLAEGEAATGGPMQAQGDSKHHVYFSTTGFHCSILDLTKIIHYIYDLFSTDFQYELIRSVFTFIPEYHLIDAPYPIRQPKRMYAVLKQKTKERAVKKEKDQKGAKGKKKEIETEEYLHLIQLQSEVEKEKEEEEDRDREEWNRRSHILPLSFAVAEEFFDKYWPPPPEEPPVPSLPDLKAKGKGKKK